MIISSTFKKVATLKTICLMLLSPPAFALESAKGDVLLKMSGQIEIFNTERAESQFDLDLLQSFPVTTIRTDTPWTDGIVVFEGVLVRDLLSAVKSSGQTLIAEDINDYFVTIPIEDAQQHDVIIAYKKSGEPMSIRDKGPLWIIYPWLDNPDLKTELHHSRAIWQLVHIRVE